MATTPAHLIPCPDLEVDRFQDQPQRPTKPMFKLHDHFPLRAAFGAQIRPGVFPRNRQEVIPRTHLQCHPSRLTTVERAQLIRFKTSAIRL